MPIVNKTANRSGSGSCVDLALAAGDKDLKLLRSWATTPRIIEI